MAVLMTCLRAWISELRHEIGLTFVDFSMYARSLGHLARLSGTTDRGPILFGHQSRWQLLLLVFRVVIVIADSVILDKIRLGFVWDLGFTRAARCCFAPIEAFLFFGASSVFSSLRRKLLHNRLVLAVGVLVMRRLIMMTKFQNRRLGCSLWLLLLLLYLALRSKYEPCKAHFV